MLFLTDLKGYDVVLGKLIATSLNSFYGLLAVFPALAIPLLFGGVTVGEFWRMVLLLANTLFFSVTAGLLVSAISRRQRTAWLGTMALIGFFIAAPLALAGLMVWLNWNGPRELVLQLSPGYAFVAALESINTGRLAGFWNSWLSIHVFAWGFLLSAAFVLPHAWQERAIPIGTRFGKWPTLGSRARSRTAARRKQLLEANPICWMACRDERQRAYLWGFVGMFVAGGVIWGATRVGTAGARSNYYLQIVPVMHLVLRIWLIAQACHFFAETRRNGAMELLLCTPLTSAELVRGQLLALKHTFLWPVLALISFEVLLPGLQFLAASQDRFWNLMLSTFTGTFGIIRLIADLFAAAYVGMWMGLSSRKPGHAAALSILYVIIIPGILACIPNVIIDVFLIIWAQNKLSGDFRASAARSLGFVSPRLLWVPSPDRSGVAGLRQPPVIRR